MTDNDEPCMCGTPFTCMAEHHDNEVSDFAALITAARQQVLDRERRDKHRLATILANTRPDDGGTEGEWALRLWEAGVRPPALRPRVTP